MCYKFGHPILLPFAISEMTRMEHRRITASVRWKKSNNYNYYIVALSRIAANYSVTLAIPGLRFDDTSKGRSPPPEIIAICIILKIPASSSLSILSLDQCKEIIDYLKKNN